MASQYPLPDTYVHRRTKSSVLSFMHHKRNQSDGAGLSSNSHSPPISPFCGPVSFLPADHPHSRALGELNQNQQSQPPPPMSNKSIDSMPPSTNGNGKKSLHKKTLSSISLKSLSRRDAEKAPKTKEPKLGKPKKTKSHTNLTNLIKRHISSKDLVKDLEDDVQAPKDKENQKPSSADATTRPPPIYAQFSSEYFTKQPLGGKFLEDEIDLYTPENYSPSKQRDFSGSNHVQQRPTLTKRDSSTTSAGLPRPRSTYLPSSFSIQDISRKISNGSNHGIELMRKVSGGKRPSFDRKSTANSNKSEKSTKSDKAVPNKGQRVMAAVSALSSKPKSPDSTLNEKDVDKEFEAMLDRRNIPENGRGKMRQLAVSMKLDLVKQDRAEVAAAKNGRPRTNGSDSSADAITGKPDVPAAKSKRPRSRTFTLSRSHPKEPTTPTKKSKVDSAPLKHSRQPSTDNVNAATKSFTATSVAAAQNLVARAKGQLPEDFIAYLRKVQKPELVEVGRLHKLRTLLKHETVAWTDEFVTQGGMAEIVHLLHRTIEVEWREEHEDALLHEVLLCVKALSTTALAIQHLCIFQQTLFPALINMVFGEDKKGPSEFTTRNIISSLLFTFLKSAPLAERAHRARILLSYLKDPEATEAERPVGFVLDMRRPRPYRVWCKEMSNVTKEVFWIFLHHVNVIALPGSRSWPQEEQDRSDSTINSLKSNGSFDSSDPHHMYMATHFPQEQPPVPAAPYVGGVEWDATNYLASHLDIINGIIASLPTIEERNTLREQMLVSGWERVFGGTLRTCKEKFYGGVHAGLRCWVAAATEDGWDTKDVRCGPRIESQGSPKKSPKKPVPVENAPKIEMKLDFGNGNAGHAERKPISDDVWL